MGRYPKLGRKKLSVCVAFLKWVSCTLLVLCFPAYALPFPSTLSGRVLDPQGNVVANAHVSLYNSSGNLLTETTSDTQGKFQFSSLAPGNYRLIAEALSLNPASSEVTIFAGRDTEITLQFQHLAPVFQSVTVLGASRTRRCPRPVA